MKVSTEEEDEEEKKTLLVGVKLDAQSRELLTWSLVKLALPGDRVVALHVLPSSNDGPDSDAKGPTLLSLAKDFDGMLAVYEGFCNLKQIDLKLKICQGPSLRKALVREANCFGATELIVGVAKNSRAIGPSPTSIAKYCAKRVAHGCAVLAVSNGKIFFEKEVTDMNKTRNHFEEKIAYKRNDSVCSSVIDDEARIVFDASNSWSRGLENESNRGLSSSKIDVDESTSLQSASPGENCLICSHDSMRNEPSCPKEDKSLSSVSVDRSECAPEVRHHWQLVQKAVLDYKKIVSKVRPKRTMIQWAMRLSNRYSTISAICADHKLNKSKSDVTSSSDSEGKSVVSLETDSSRSSDTVEHEVAELPKVLESLQEKYSSVCRLFSYKELKQATSDFSPEKLIGKGGSSHVYKGYLSDGKELAVKILKPSADVLREFVSEIEIITTLNHKNITSLFGFCFENNSLILVYEFLSNGSLEEILHGGEEHKNVLSWIDRCRVAMGVAEAIDYLHSRVGAQPLIHRDVKSSNILLFEDFEPKLSDFGLAKWVLPLTSHITCNDVAGTFGYLAPEYFMYGKVNEKVDVYAFGVVLLELLSGRKPINTGCPKGQESLVMWAKPILDGGKVKQLADPCMGDEYDIDQMERMALAASLCIRRAPRRRPQIATLLKLLQGDDDTAKWARLELKNSEELDGLDDEAAFRQDSDIKSYLNLALLDVEDDSLSISSLEQTVDFITANTSLDEYLQGRCS